MHRRLEFVSGRSAKFWEIHVDGSRLRVRFGRLGAAGQTQDHTFAEPVAATRQAQRLIAAKLNKGYVEQPVR